jgi:hypothetical protein
MAIGNVRDLLTTLKMIDDSVKAQGSIEQQL